MNIRLIPLSLIACMSLAAGAQRMPTVTYNVSGSANNWLLDFTVVNHFLTGEGELYGFGVYLDTGRDIVASPGLWNPNTWPTWDNSGLGGSSLIYNNNWEGDGASSRIAPGASLSGFVARSTSASAPTSVRFWAAAKNGVYGGDDHFWHDDNPFFEGVAGAPVPEPATLALSIAAVAAGLRRRIRASRSADGARSSRT